MNVKLWMAVVIIATVAPVVWFFTRPTESRRIHRTFRDLTEAIAANDVDRALSFFDPQAVSCAGEYRRYAALATVQRVRISQFQVKSVNKFTSPPTAVVSFNSGCTVRENRFGTVSSFIVVFDQVELVQDGENNWKVTDRIKYHVPNR
ncbi:MAG: hypothetical protein J6S75_05625 [Thermoguttaceae bacterium]|nr:hypothetical protein [Thermoguttaceae bacterium]